MNKRIILIIEIIAVVAIVGGFIYLEPKFFKRQELVPSFSDMKQPATGPESVRPPTTPPPGQSAQNAPADWKTWDRSKLEYYQKGQGHFTIKLPQNFNLEVVEKGWPYSISDPNDYKKKIWMTDSNKNIDVYLKDAQKISTDIIFQKTNDILKTDYSFFSYEISTGNKFECSECYYELNSKYYGIQIKVDKDKYYYFETKSDFGKDLFYQILSTFKFTK